MAHFAGLIGSRRDLHLLHVCEVLWGGIIVGVQERPDCGRIHQSPEGEIDDLKSSVVKPPAHSNAWIERYIEHVRPRIQ